MSAISRCQRLFLFLPALALLGCNEEAEPTPDADGNTPGFGVVIRADSNRDGKVDLVGASDEEDKLNVTRDRGALFLPNIDDDSGRCDGHAKPRECFDAADEVVNGEQDARDLARVKTLPLNVSEAAVATLTLVSKKMDAVRLFHETSPGQFVAVASGHKFTPQQVRAGIHLAVEGKVPVMDTKVWDGRIELHYEVQDQGKRAVNKVALKVAPLLSHSHADAIEHLIAAPIVENPNMQAFRRDVDLAVQNGPFAPKHTYLNAQDEWAQDWVEPLYASIPGENGPVSIHVLLGSHQERVKAYNALYTLQGPDVGVTLLSEAQVQSLPDSSGTYSSFGNLETIPPYAGYPAGRQVIGGSLDKKEGPSPKTLAFLAAQGAQDLIWLDSSWLSVGHIDEFLSFLPVSGSTLGFKIVVVDPLVAVEILKTAMANGHGDVLLNSYKPSTDAEKAATKTNQVDFTTTVRQFLEDAEEMAAQKEAAGLIEKNLEILKAATQIPDEDIVRLPGLFERTESFGLPDELPEGDFPDDGKQARASMEQEIQALSASHPYEVKPYGRLLAGLSTERRLQMVRWLTSPKPRSESPRQEEEKEYKYEARVPDVVNMAVSPDGQVLAPKQFGPVVQGKDIFEVAVQAELAKSGYRAHFVDDYTTFHLAGGEVHCGTNTIRAPRENWWAK